MNGTPGIETLFGRSFLRRQASRAAAKGRLVKKAAKKTVVGRVIVRSADTAARNVSKGAAVVGRVAGRAAGVASRVAKRLIRKIARPIMGKMLKGDLLGGLDMNNPALQKAVVAAVSGPAMAAVAAGGITAPALPAVPVLVSEVVSELWEEVKKGGKKVLEVADAISDPVADRAIVAQEKASLPDSSPVTQAIQTAKKRPIWLYAGGGLFTLGFIVYILKERKKKNAVNR